MAYLKSSISFGLVNIPVQLQPAVKDNNITFRMLDKKTLSKIKYKKTCVECSGAEVKQENIVKGYEYEKDKYVIMDDSDFEKIKTKKDKTISIECFVALDEIDPIFYDKAYYLLPEKSNKSFVLFKNALEQENKVGIAKTVIGTKEVLLAVRVKNGELILNTMYFFEEIQSNIAAKIEADINDKEVNMAKTIIKGMTEKFKPEQYKDEYRDKLAKAIDVKISGKSIKTVDKTKSKPAISLMDALQQSIKLISTKPPSKKEKDETKNKNNKTANVIKMKKAN